MTEIPAIAPVRTGAPSKVEGIKRGSRQLRGTIAETLRDETAATFGDTDAQLLKNHGVYQQYDRDTATARKQQGLDKEHQFMARVRIPGGRLTADQYLALDALASGRANGTMRVTTRQTIQFHGTLKGNLHALLNGISKALLTTMAACGDVVRNVTATPAPIRDNIHETLNREAARLSATLLPRSTAYHEIWVDGERVDPEPVEEPVYGAAYLPRKFKIGLATPDDNSIDVFTNDLGIIAHFDGQDLRGYTLAVGGGLGMTHNKPRTYPRLATPLLFVEPEGLLDAVIAVIKVQRDFGDRTDRKRARLKYLLDDMGLPWFKAQVEAHAGRDYAPPRPMPRFRIVDHMGWHAQGDGRWYLGIPVESGRIADGERSRLRTALRTIVGRHRPEVILCPSQDVILADIADGDREAITALLRDHGVRPAEALLPVERWSLACPALPTCGLALTEAERIREPIIGRLVERLRAHGLEHETISVRITGCPNGCARPYAGDIGLVGRMPGYFALYVGGDFEGTRLNFRLLDKVGEDEVPQVLDPLLEAFARTRQGPEGFGDWCSRMGPARLAALVEQAMPAVSI